MCMTVPFWPWSCFTMWVKPKYFCKLLSQNVHWQKKPFFEGFATATRSHSFADPSRIVPFGRNLSWNFRYRRPMMRITMRNLTLVALTNQGLPPWWCVSILLDETNPGHVSNKRSRFISTALFTIPVQWHILNFLEVKPLQGHCFLVPQHEDQSVKKRKIYKLKVFLLYYWKIIFCHYLKWLHQAGETWGHKVK